MKSKNCSHDVEESDGHCGKCGKEIVLEHEMKRCPSCKEFQKADVLSCTNCKESIIICKEKKNDGSSCKAFIAPTQNYCKGCGKKVKRDADKIADELDGGKKSQGAQNEVISKIGSTIEQKTEPVEDPRKTEETLPARALAVICTHTIFDKKLAKERPSGLSDKEMMEKTWKSYDDCEVLSFLDQTNSFYEEDLAIEIQRKLVDLKNVKYFVFVLSTHGQENNEKGTMKHYFYTKDGQFQTQDLMTKISSLKGIDKKMKMFFIQACRSRATNREQDNLDQGYYVDNAKNIKSSSEEIAERMDNPDSAAIFDEYNYPEENETIEITPTEEIPHCDGCVVVFASMAGKYAYSRVNDHLDDGGWMIRALQSTLDQYQEGECVHILDILTGVNRKVSQKWLGNPLDNNDRCFIHLDLLKIEIKKKQDLLKKEIEKKQDLLKNEIEKKNCKSSLSKESLTKLEDLSNKVGKLQLNVDFSKGCKDEIFDITSQLEKIIGEVTLKAQSCFSHCLAFEEKDMTLQKNKQ